MVLTQIIKNIAQGCTESSFFGIGTWYKYVPKQASGSACRLNLEDYGVGAVFLILAGIVDILLRIGALVAVGYFIFGAFKMVMSQGSPEQIKDARGTMTNALIGLILCILSTWMVSFVIGNIFK